MQRVRITKDHWNLKKGDTFNVFYITQGEPSFFDNDGLPVNPVFASEDYMTIINPKYCNILPTIGNNPALLK